MKYEPGKIVVVGSYVGRGVSRLPVVMPSPESFEGFKVGQLYDWSKITYADKTEIPSRQKNKDN